MDKTKQDFENRKTEIENYFKFLSIFDNDETRLKYLKEGKITIEKIQPNFQVILIANTFLILYNLIESTVRNSIIDIYMKIEDDEISYEDLSENLQKIWINQRITNKLKERNYKQSTLHKYIINIINEILKKEIIALSGDKLDSPGNLDAERIRALARKIGFDISPNGRNLAEIASRRNRLAHGQQTFYDVGKDFTVNELVDFKNETFNYLSDVINKIELFITEKKYTTN